MRTSYIRHLSIPTNLFNNKFALFSHATVSNTTMSQKQLAIVVNSDITTYSLKSIDVPKPEADEILVKIHAAAQNPVDCE